MLSKISTFALLCITSYAVPVASKPHLVVFGDSFSDLNNRENINNPPILWKGRFSDGPVWNEYLAYFNDYTLINYAVGGATTNNTSVRKFTNASIPYISILDQITLFRGTFGEKFKSGATDNDIAVIEIGTNDINSGLERIANTTIDKNNYPDSIVNNIIEAINKVLDLGYKTILVANLPNLKSAPFILEYPPLARENIDKYISNINEKLAVAVNNEHSKPGKRGVKLVDLDKLFSLVTGTIGKELGIKIVDKGCITLVKDILNSTCANSNEYAFKDGLHPTTKVHSFFGSVFAETLKNDDFSIDLESTLPLIAKYDLANANYLSNFMYYPDSYETGKIKIESYNIFQATINAQSIIDSHNRDTYPKKYPYASRK
ncbi:hypothetical protein BB561_002412 [Smittium simulii]|uniref:SGNH hydrolase-type esterase domain-containing protein n=1 Tax=Smittium simulii TaxID=133385 RepID=A0A2T9YQJ8_9FUNG|nr:hypothetical protein BB561_002412 [Smittium simulii]